MKQVGWVCHGVQKFRRGSFADQPVFKQANRARGMRPAGDQKREHRQSHPDEDKLMVGYFARGCRDHQFAVTVTSGFVAGICRRCQKMLASE
jgi:hypothetical protein